MKHLNTAEEVVAGWESGHPVIAMCGYARVVVEGEPAEGEVCIECAAAADAAGMKMPTRTLNPKEMRSYAKELWLITQVSRWTYKTR